MKQLLLFVLLGSSLCWAKDVVQVEIKATHVATRTARSHRDITERGIMGANSPGRSVEVYDLDCIINGEHVVLTCDDDQGCESPKLGTYEGEVRRRGHVRVKFTLPLTDKQVNRWYKVAGSW